MYQAMPPVIEIYGQGGGVVGRKRIDPEALAEKLELPPEALGSLLVTAVGHRRLLIENHRGIELYSDICLRLRAAEGCFAVYGDGLCIRTLGGGLLAVEGNIRSMEWEG